jgi:hypothetical protein
MILYLGPLLQCSRHIHNENVVESEKFEMDTNSWMRLGWQKEKKSDSYENTALSEKLLTMANWRFSPVNEILYSVLPNNEITFYIILL